MTFKDKVCPICNRPFKKHVITLHSSELVECLLEATGMEKEDLEKVGENQ